MIGGQPKEGFIYRDGYCGCSPSGPRYYADQKAELNAFYVVVEKEFQGHGNLYQGYQMPLKTKCSRIGMSAWSSAVGYEGK